MQGVVVSDYKPCFMREDVEKIFALPSVPTLSTPLYIFTSADPNGGGPSHMAMCSGYYDKSADFIVSFPLVAPLYTLALPFEQILAIPPQLCTCYWHDSSGLPWLGVKTFASTKKSVAAQIRQGKGRPVLLYHTSRPWLWPLTVLGE